MHLRSIVLKGFKSFPDRTRLEFAPGVSVIVGPNGSGKSNVTDAVLWALGEQSPLAVRGQTMQDVIFAGGHGIPSRSAAEVEVVIDNSSNSPSGLASEFSEISIVRRLDRSGEGEYRLNGARCRLADVIEVLSDTGLGKEMHSVVSQGRVEAIVHSKPRDRRLLIEEAAGLGKHRKRRRRAQLKLERTEANLARALDVEREARSRLRPLKRQAEAAELHERIERQSLEARLELARDRLGIAGRDLVAAEVAAWQARGERDEAERLLAAVSERREQAEEAFAEHSRARERISGRLHSARSAGERIAMRLERAADVASAAGAAAVRRSEELAALEAEAEQAAPDDAQAQRIEALEEELARLEGERADALERELAGLRADREAAEARRAELEAAVEARRAEREESERAAEAARNRRVEADRQIEAARRDAAAAGAELAAANSYLRTAAGSPPGARALAEDLGVEPGCELAVAAVLGQLLRAGVADDIREAGRLLDSASRGGASTLVAGRARVAAGPLADGGGHRAPPVGGHSAPPIPGARPLLDFVDPRPPVVAVAERLLGDAWLVDSLDDLPDDFAGIAATRGGRAFVASTGELRQAAAGGEQRLLEERGRREKLIVRNEAAARAEAAAQLSADDARDGVTAAHAARDAADGALRTAIRELDEAAEAVHRAEWIIERRTAAPDQGPSAVRMAELRAELRAERLLLEGARREAEERTRRMDWLSERIEGDRGIESDANRARAALEAARAAVTARSEALSAELEADREIGERTAAELRACAREEAEIQGHLRKAGEAVTAAEVRAQQLRDASAESAAEHARIAERLGLDPEGEAAAPLPEPLSEEARADLEARLERLARRREQLGPVNPLAKREYEEAVTHVEELETQRSDLEAAMAELEGLIKETDRRIRESFEETFEAAARNFEDTVAHLFPGGRGRLRLVRPEGPRPVIGGEEGEPGEAGAEESAEAEAASEELPEPEEPGVEIEVTPAGKATKRLSLMSGGEKSLVAIAFLFAVFLARPCPFYILDEVEAALDDANIDRFLQLVRRNCDRAQFIVVTHQKRTMDAADCLYGVSMGNDGVSKVVSRRLGPDRRIEALDGGAAGESAGSEAA